MRAVKDWVTVYESEDVLMRVEVHNELPFLHCEIERWSPKQYKYYMELWMDILDMLKANQIDYLFVWALDDKVKRFAQMFGFKLIFTDEADQSLLFLKY